MSDFDLSPRSSKRRKIVTYGSKRSTAASTGFNPPSVLRSLSNVVSGMSRRLLEPQTESAAVAPAFSPAHGSDEQILDQDDDLQDACEVCEEQGNGDVCHAAAGTNRSARNDAEAARHADVVAPARKSARANQSAKDSEGVDRSQEKLSARKLRVREETTSPLTKVSHNNIRTSSPNNRRSIQARDAENETVKKDTISSRRSGAGPVTTPKQSKRSNAVAASNVRKEVVVEIEAEKHHDNITVGQRSSGREKRKPTRYAEVVEDMAEQRRKQPVVILTPSKQDRAGVRRSITFADDERQLAEQVSFRDIPKQTRVTDNIKRKGRTRKSSPTIATESEQLTPSSDAAPVGRGDDSEEEQQLAVEDMALPDVQRLLNSSSSTPPGWDLLPGADEDSCLTAIKSKVISRLTNSSLVPLTGLETEYAKIHSLLKATVTAGEGNSILVLGARGSGKTNLVETALTDVTREHTEDFHIVRLNGFQQTDDKIALREIWRQLGREMQVDEGEINQVSSYADTMASLLHLLSHPEELAETLDPDAPVTTTKSVVFVLDEFDLFAAHPRQTLLYNLFDIAQAKKAPIAVIGCSTRVDVAELLEKRVKSRFSHRWLHLSLPKSFQAFEAVVKAALCVMVDEDEMLDDEEGHWRNAWNEYMASTFIPSQPVQTLLRQTFYTTKSISAVFSSLHLPIAGITSVDDPSKMPTSLAPLMPPDSLLYLLPCLPPLHLYLLVSATRLDAIHNASIINFDLVYHHYVELASRSRLQSSASGALAQSGVTKIWGKEIAKAAWEELAEWEILVPAALGKGKGEDAAETKMWRVDVTLEEIAVCAGGVGPGVSEALLKWCKEV